jgi:adenylate cyclase
MDPIPTVRAGDANDGEGPGRTSVEQLLRKSELEGEYTVGWVRIAVGLALLTSGLFVSSGGDLLDRGQQMNSATGLTTVGAYIALGVMSFVLVSRGLFRPWTAYLLVTADAAVLGLSLHVSLANLGLDGNWISIVPVIWVAPLALAVGALRYRPAVQLWGTAAMLLTLAVVAVDLGFRPVLDSTGAPANQAASIASLHSLSPYIMRAVMLLLVGLITTLVILRSRHLLLRAVDETVRRMDLSRFLPAEIAPLVEGGGLEQWRHGRRQNAVILFADIRASTALAERMDPERLSVFISSFRRRVMRAAAEYGGVVDKFIGDGALVVFGVPEIRGDEGQRAVSFAIRLLGYIDQWNIKRGFDPPVRIGVGIHAGEIYWGLVGDARRIEFTVLGDTVNVAAKVEQATKTYHVPLLVSAQVLPPAGPGSDWAEVGREPLGGRQEQLALFARVADLQPGSPGGGGRP